MDRYEFDPNVRMLLEKSIIPFGVYQYVDKQLVAILLSNGYFELFGYDDREDTYRLMDNDMFRNIHPDDVKRVADTALLFMREDTPFDVIFRSIHNDNNMVIHAYGKHIYPDENTRLGVIYYMDEGEYYGDHAIDQNILKENYSSSLAQATSQMKFNYDILTGLPNMGFFIDSARSSIQNLQRYGEHCAIGFININGMKHYNRKYGFSEGGVLLSNLADLMVRFFGKKNCSRFGQDNFAFFALPDGLEEQLKKFLLEFYEMNKEKPVSIRIGVYPDTMGIVDVDIACDRARYACNTIKNMESSGYVFFDDSMLKYETRRQYIIDNLDRAIEERWLQPYFQPIVRSANGSVSDEETLCRWIDPEKGMLSPIDFIPILEDAKLIYMVDLHMLDMTLEKLKKQKEEGLYVVPSSINLSRTDFDCCDIVDEICKRVDASGLGRNVITIEITESVVGEDFDFIKEQVERFQSLGFHVWMDDFGSGFSSLDVLQNIRFDLIKLDMRFMKQFNSNERSRIIITELIKMAMSLGIETVCEGVETAEQVEFLRQVGCTKMQGYYFCKPISYEQILERYNTGVQIGFENPDESDYYEAIGRINMYDISVVARDDTRDVNKNGQYFDTLPMAIVEADTESIKVVRCNKSYIEFVLGLGGSFEVDRSISYDFFKEGVGAVFAEAVKKCYLDGKKVFIDERLKKDSTIHALVKRVAVNPVTGVVSCAVVVLGIIPNTGRGVTFEDIANSLSADYINLYYVNLNTDEFTEFRPDTSSSGLSEERHGIDFFKASRRDALTHLYIDDQEKFLSAFSKKNVLSSIDNNGSFTFSYRLLIEGEPVYVNMKAIRMRDDEKHIIVGVNNINAYMVQREALERMLEERRSFALINALSGNYICIYSVNLQDNTYVEYSSTSEYENLGIAKHGDDFFAETKVNSKKFVYEEDREYFVEMMDKENILKTIEESGILIINYRMVIDEKLVYVGLRGVLVDDNEGQRLVIGISNIDSQIRRDQDYENKNT